MLMTADRCGLKMPGNVILPMLLHTCSKADAVETYYSCFITDVKIHLTKYSRSGVPLSQLTVLSMESIVLLERVIAASLIVFQERLFLCS